MSGRHVFSKRDRLLFALVAEATARGEREIELPDATVDSLVTADGEPDAVPPHIDLGARIHATSRAVLDRGDYTFTVVPGRAAGTLTSRFTPLVPDADLGGLFAEVPTTTVGALPAQLSFTPMFPSAENVARVPRYLPDVVSIGEHARGEAIGVDDLAVTATTRRLHLVSLSRRRVVEPVVLHALALKQQRTWRCPSRVELRDFDQLLPLDLDVSAHREVLYRHVRSNDDAVLVEAPEPGADGWLDGRAHGRVSADLSPRAGAGAARGRFARCRA